MKNRKDEVKGGVYTMNMDTIINRIKEHPLYHKMGMIACHLGVVRGTSLDGRKVKGIEVDYDQDKINLIINDIKEMPGIFEVLVDISKGRLEVGENIMLVAVGGDIRENVFPALITVVDRIKKEGTLKKELF